MRASLTEMQQRVYHFLVDYIREHKYPPTVREIMDHFGLRSSNSVAVHLGHLRNKGYITSGSTSKSMRCRTLQLVDDVVGDFTVSSDNIKRAISNLKKRGYVVKINEAIELLTELRISIA